MLLRNFDCAIMANMLATSKDVRSVDATDTLANIRTQSTSGTIGVTWLGTATNSNTGIFPVLPFCASSICIGNGTKAVSYEDYRLSGSKIGGKFTNISNTLVFSEDNNCWVRTLVVKYTNESDEDFVVSEWGIYKPATQYGYNSDSDTYVYTNSSDSEALVWRELLDEPITIAANSTATLTFTLTVPHEVNRF